MKAAGPFRVRRRGLELCAVGMICAGLLPNAGVPAFAVGPTQQGNAPTGQPIRIPMEPLGFQPVLEDFLLAGVTGLTVDFVDNDHLLVTFNTKHLMKREPDELPSDDDRTIEAVLVELPSGKPLARAEWRLYDRMQYLWNLGHGRFLLRVRDRLTMLAPLERLADGDAFRGTPVLDQSLNGGDRHIVALLVSSDQDLLTLETTRRLSGPAGTANDVSFSGSDEGAPVQINFYRLNYHLNDGQMNSGGRGSFTAESAGVVRAPAPLAVPMTRAGILDVLDGGKNRWLFNFNEHAGKIDELAEWDTTCAPRVMFVGHSEFVAFGCRGSEDKPEIAGFNLKGEQMWEQGLYDSYVSPAFAYAPAAGRFALERTIVGAPMGPDASLPVDAVQGEEVRVYQTYSGKILLKVNCSPVERAGGNFALSPDGMRLAAFDQTSRQRTTQLGDPYMEKATSLVVYPLPPLSDRDRASVKEMEAKAPADTGARIDASLARLSQESEAGAVAKRTQAPGGPQVAAAGGGPGDSTTGAGSPEGAPASGTATNTNATGDQEPGNPAMTGQLPNAPGMGASQNGGDAAKAEDGTHAGPRQPPTLYEPGETPPPQKSKGEQ